MGCKIDGRDSIEDARLQLRWPTVIDPHRRDTPFRKLATKLVVQRVGGAHESAHSAGTTHDNALGVRRTVPEQTQQSGHRVDLAVTQPGGELDLLHPQWFK